MYYVDTCVLISYVFASDSGHEASQRALEDIVVKQGHKLYGSTFTLVEACNSICRKITKEAKWRLSDPLQRYIDIYKDYGDRHRQLISLIFSFLKEKLNIEFVDNEDLYKFETTGLDKLEMPRIFKESIELSYKISVRIKDLLHLAYAYMLSKTHNIRFFLTRDIGDFKNVKDAIKHSLQIEVVLIE